MRADPEIVEHHRFLDGLYDVLLGNDPLALSTELDHWDKIIEEISNNKPSAIIRPSFELFDIAGNFITDIFEHEHALAEIQFDFASSTFNAKNTSITDSAIKNCLKFDETINIKLQLLSDEKLLEKSVRERGADSPETLIEEFWKDIEILIRYISEQMPKYIWINGKGQPWFSELGIGITPRQKCLRLAKGEDVKISLTIDIGRRLIDKMKTLDIDYDVQEDILEDEYYSPLIDMCTIGQIPYFELPLVDWCEWPNSPNEYEYLFFTDKPPIFKHTPKFKPKSNGEYSESGVIAHFCPGLSVITIKRIGDANFIIPPFYDDNFLDYLETTTRMPEIQGVLS